MPAKKAHSRPHPDLPPLHPGEVLREDILPSLDMSAQELARALGVTPPAFKAIVEEKKPVTPDVAIRLAKAFKPSAEFWLRLQAAYDLWHAGRTIDTSAIPKLHAAE